MKEYNFPVPGSANEKDMIIFVRRHWVAFLGQVILICLLLLFPIGIYFIAKSTHIDPKYFQGILSNILTLGISIYYLVILTFAFIAWVSFYYNCYIVTCEEIIEITQVGFFGRKISQTSLLRVQDVTSNVKGFIQTFFHFGNVLIETASEQKEVLQMEFVANPQEITSRIMELHDEAINVEARHRQMSQGEGTLTPEPKNIEPPATCPPCPPSETPPQESSISPPPESTAPPELSPPPSPPPSQTPYQELLKKDQTSPPQNEGQINHDDLDKGGKIDM